MHSSLYDFAKTFCSNDAGTKPAFYYRKYDEIFGSRRFAPSAIVELGVHRGESTKVFATVYPNAKIIGIDLYLKEIDITGYPNLSYVQIDQTDSNALRALVDANFPSGLDLVIDDASHIGAFSYETFNILFPMLKSGGLYIIEDWGTGYWADWPDGASYRVPSISSDKRRLPSHDFGMVGFVKTLIDLVGHGDISHSAPEIDLALRLKSLDISAGVCIVEKA